MTHKTDWTTVKFGDVVRLNTNRIADPEAEGIERYVGIEHIEPEDLHIRSWGLVAEGTTFTNHFRPGHVLFVKRRAYQRKVAVAEFEGVCSGDIYVLEPKDDRLLPDLLPFICQADTFFAHAVNTSAGSLSPRTHWKQLSQYEFPLPPLAEQRRLAKLLTILVEIDEGLTIAWDKSRKMRNAFLNSLFFTESDDYQEYGRFRVPTHWRLLTLPELVVDKPLSLTAGPFGTIFKAKDFRSEGVPIIQIRHITEGGFQFDDGLTFMDADVYHRVHRPYTVYPGDLLITKLGDPPGMACLYPDDAPIGMVTPDVIKATINEGIIYSDFAVYVFNNHRARANVLRLCKGGTRTRVSLNKFYALQWPVPPLDEQSEILEILRPISEFRRQAQHRKLMTSILRKKLMFNMESEL